MGGHFVRFFHLVDHRLVLKILLATSADAFIMAHNHPDMLQIPSKADIDNTHGLRHKAELFGIEYLDEIILTKKRYYSFREQDLIW